MADGSKARGLSARIKKQFSGPDSFALEAALDIPAGNTILFGPSGAGKSTLLDCIAGVQPPDEGRVRFTNGSGGETLFDAEGGVNVPLRARRIGYVFQNMALFPNMTALENVEYGLRGMSKAERRERARKLLDSFHVAHAGPRKPNEISGGERQRVALARTLAPEPRLLLLDEPLSALDAATKAAILENLREWQERHPAPALYVTHSRREAMLAGESMIILQAGRVVARGATRKLLAGLAAIDD